VTTQELSRHAQRLLAPHALADADPAPLAALLARCSQRHLTTGEPLFQEGDAAGELTFLLEGRVSVMKKDPGGEARQIGSWFAPALVGGLAAVEGARRSASCIAGAPSVAAVLPAADARAILADPGPAGAQLRFMLLAAFTEALANTTQHLRELLSAPQSGPPPEIDRLLALLHGAKR
jgi:CRP-like cAMP-binding protein